MCIMCDGASRDEVMFHVHATVLRHGWALQAVGGDDVRADWIYTVGLSSGFAHPELVIVGGAVLQAASILNELGEIIRRGRRFGSCDQIDLPEGRFTFEEVHPRHLSEGLVAICDEYHEALGGPQVTERALQVVPRLAPGWDDERTTPLLSDPTAEIAGAPMARENRAARRARARSRSPHSRGGS